MPTIELVPVSALHPAPYNPREADTERLELVALSLRKLGFLLPLVATKDGEILSGHQRHRMAAAMGASRVPVLHADIQGAKRRGLNILFNRATNDISVQDTEQDMIPPCMMRMWKPWLPNCQIFLRTARTSICA